ncbi:MAG: DUF2147 domain-containing protein [Rhodobacteraceae bacterium]|nr:DUF2147 domain-containing protein [Paracoccaceae bacterium]
MTHLFTSVVTLVAMSGAVLADDLIGNWYTAPNKDGDTGIVQISQCGSALCGALVGALDSAGMSVELEPEDVGQQIIWDTLPTDQPGEYRGMIYSPDRDRDYRSLLQLSGNTLSVSGCVFGGAICREGEQWRRAN